jgi:BCD family chlorophyll transporter-like MFS transporter
MGQTARYLNLFRLAAFPVGLGVTGVLVSGTLNRVMIVELGLPASLVGLFFAIPVLIVPLRVWMGHRSDAYPIGGLRREPYIVLGSLVAGLGVVGATLLALDNPAPGLLALAAILLAFLAYGLGKHLSSNTFEALLADRFEGDARPRAVNLLKVAMFVGIFGGAILLGRLLEPFDPGRLAAITLGVAALAFTLAAFATLRQEPRTAAIRSASQHARQTPFLRVIREIVWRDPQVRTFFVLVSLTVLGTLGQDVLLEPYGALALGLTVAQTTRLTAIWGAGVILAMLAAGVWLIRRFGYRPALRAGLLLCVAVFAGLILAGVMGSAGLFMTLVFLLGVGTGLASAGLLTAVIEFTTAVRAGLLMGVWGVAHELGEAVGGLFGGVIVDAIRAVTGENALAAYGTVFAAEGLLLLAALALLNRVQVSQALVQAEAERAASSSSPEPSFTPVR